MKLLRAIQVAAGQGDDAPALVFVHGFMGGPADYMPMVARLGARFRCIAVELAGHGDVALPDAPLTLHNLARQLRDDILKPLKNPTLIGYSMGGRLALQCALDHPESLAKLVLISTSPGIEDPEERRARRAQDASRAGRILQDFDAFLEDWYRLGIFGNLGKHPQLPAMLARRRQQSPAAIARVIGELSPGEQPSNWQRLGALLGERPYTTWIVGADDPKYRRLGEELTAQGHTVRVAPNAAHALHIEAPDWLARQLEDVVARDSKRGAPR